MQNADTTPWRLCVAPMMRYTDRHCRAFHRIAAPSARLYTEMVSTDALLHGDRNRLLRYSPQEHPVALQLGGRNVVDLAKATEIGSAAGFDEVNLNVGCPSERVQAGGIGACLMLEPAHVAAAIRAMRGVTDVPVTVKCRLGVDGHDDYDFVHRFISVVADAGVETFVIHARIAVLSGLSPAANREVPPLRYADVERLATDFPSLTFVLNGGIRTRADVDATMSKYAGLMIGRAAYHDPMFLAQTAAALAGVPPIAMTTMTETYRRYVAAELDRGERLAPLVRPLIGLAKGQPGARSFRRTLTEGARSGGAGIAILDRALDVLAGSAVSVAA